MSWLVRLALTLPLVLGLGAPLACASAQTGSPEGPCSAYADDPVYREGCLEICEARLAAKRKEIQRDRSLSGADKARVRAVLDNYRCE